MEAEVVKLRSLQVLALLGGVVAGSALCGVVDDATKPKEGEKAGMLSTYGGPAATTLVGGAIAVMKEGDDEQSQYIRLFGAGMAAEGVRKGIGRAIPSSDSDSKAKKALIAAFGATPEATPDYTPEIAYTTETDTQPLPAYGAAENHAPASSPYDALNDIAEETDYDEVGA